MKCTAALLTFAIGFQSMAYAAGSGHQTNPSKPDEGNPSPVVFKPKPAQPSYLPTWITYSDVAGKVSFSILDADVHAKEASPVMKATVDKLLAAYKQHEADEQLTYEQINASGYSPANSAIIDVVDDERMLADMKSESLFYDSVIYLMNSVGIGALGTLAAYGANILSQSQGFPPTRFAFAVTTITAAMAKGTVKIVEDQKKALDAEIALLQQHIDDRFNYLMWQADYGGDSTGTFRPPTCIYKTSCVETKVCVSEGLIGKENCRYRDVCNSEILTCRSE
jgi:hypothetical protein